ncbi:hypothetical protein BTA51_15780 [Hahella sp. CCB-MM4]|uniref:hypothetical protein n=1 Tax=Hahella sp. (strain CCB-MM4) TaxID=1926491 RepID=UPI000B9A3426|nr:hypothetical protein [Hahella sp. CCB-MM4]OZG72569.1 hypothetical protein BTA51_15780 [Hahella sp. CCB-MM4]
MKQWIFAVLLAEILVLGTAGQAVSATLAPEHEMQRLLLVADESIKSMDYGKAKSALDRIGELAIDPEVKYFYFKGLVDANSGEREAARDALVEYVNRAGSEGEYYEKALRMITELDTERAESTPANKPEIDWSQVVTSENDQYLAELKKLYLTNSDEKAVLEHINSILKENVYVSGRIRHLDKNEGRVFRISTNSKDELVVQETDYTKSGNASHTLSRLPVFGVDPYVQSDCNFERRECWLWHPVDKDKWIVIADNQEALGELSRAMTALIRLLQK